MYLVVVRKQKATGNIPVGYECVQVSTNLNQVTRLGLLTKEVLLNYVSKGLKPLNFSVDRTGEILEDCGSFDRFSPKGSAVVLAEVKNYTGRILGYRLLSCRTFGIVNIEKAKIIEQEKRYKDEYFLQNGIVRGDTINCYPRKPFISHTLENKPKKPLPPVQAKPVLAKPQPKVEVKPQPVEKPKVTMDMFTKEQLREIKSAKDRGINPRFILNPELSPKHMNLLWKAKAKKNPAEYYNDPKIPLDVLKFYASVINTPWKAQAMKPVIANTNIGRAEATELYNCMCRGIPFEDLINQPAGTIHVESIKRGQSIWFGYEDMSPKALKENLDKLFSGEEEK